MSLKRIKFAGVLVEQLGKDVLWNMDGPSVFDCSGLGCYALKKIGGPDLRATYRAQSFADLFPPIVEPEKPDIGDACFYGDDWANVIHIAFMLAGGHIISADGASSRITTLAEAKRRDAKVRVHITTNFRKDFLGWRRNTFLDAPKEPNA